MKATLRMGLGVCATLLLLVGMTKASAAIDPLMKETLATQSSATAAKCTIPCMTCDLPST
ncbi:hypothetical protein [Nibricoccus sp. IMCC34717]|uniref:hypothetical protein n=1 Tax=Nibricoccus sp. IMCC34717 TaxID=3034021 RepID=UPI00384DFB2D